MKKRWIVPLELTNERRSSEDEVFELTVSEAQLIVDFFNTYNQNLKLTILMEEINDWIGK